MSVERIPSSSIIKVLSLVGGGGVGERGNKISGLDLESCLIDFLPSLSFGFEEDFEVSLDLDLDVLGGDGKSEVEGGGEEEEQEQEEE